MKKIISTSICAIILVLGLSNSSHSFPINVIDEPPGAVSNKPIK